LDAATTLHIRSVSRLEGALRLPGDKSVSHRYALLGACAEGTTTVAHLSSGADVASTLACVSALGAALTRVDADRVRIRGCGAAGFRPPDRVLDAGNSGTTTRLLAGLLAACPFTTVLTGDASLRRRPMRRVIDPLAAMGARIESAAGCAPLHITGGPLAGIRWRPPVASAQVKSAILLAGLAASGTTVVEEPVPTRDHTERAFPSFSLAVSCDATTRTIVGPQRAIAPSHPLTVPGDPSSAAVWAAAAAARSGSDVRIHDVCLNPLRLGFARALARMGADIGVEDAREEGGEPVGTLRIRHRGLADVVITPEEVPDLIDELPVLAASAVLGGVALEVSGAAELRVKESDRITALVAGLRSLGADADERPDGFVVDGRRRPRGGVADAAADHRLVMAFALVGLGTSSPTTVTGADAVAVSYPDFVRDLEALAR
jgi:3-phosphoshikimate 1-carboxyvinyltransferase